MLPLHRNDGMEPKRRLANADFYRMQIVAKKKKKKKKNESGAKREGQSGFRNQDILLALKNSNDKDLYSRCSTSALKVLFQGS